jgi:hypothetical protein
MTFSGIKKTIFMIRLINQNAQREINISNNENIPTDETTD